MPEYHNPDPLVRLIGDANEAPAIVEGVPITSLVDSGACMSAMVKSFAKELRLEIKPLKTILDIEGTGGGTVPYYGYVECRLKLPQIEKFDVDVLMLIIDDRCLWDASSCTAWNFTYRYGFRFSHRG